MSQAPLRRRQLEDAQDRGARRRPSSRRCAAGIPAGVDVAVCPPFTALADTVRAAAGGGIAVYAQNMHQAESGAFTGEVSAAMLVAAGVDGVLIGHSERRQFFGETDAAVNEKAARAHAAGLHVILAVGETAAEREGELTEQVLERQVRGGLHGLDPEQVAATTLAYEPVWAIGTGLTATPEMAQAAHAFIRGLVEGSHGVGERRAHPVRRQRQAGQRGRAVRPARHRRRADRRREPRAG